MKRAIYLLGGLVIWSVLLTSCAIDLSPEPKWTDLELELGLDQPEIPVCLGYDMPFESAIDPTTKSSVVGGVEESSEYVKTLHMVCFTKEGIYLGKRQAQLVGTEGNLQHKDAQDNVILTCWGREFFEGTVPARTARIHFVANVFKDDYLPLDSQVGSNENMVIKSARMSVPASDTSHICYWGFHGEPNSESMKAWLAVVQDDGQGNVTYSKRDDSNVHLIRDRAKLTFEAMNDVYSDPNNPSNPANPNNQIDYRIISIDWILSNGLSRGYLAPYNEHNTSDHFVDYFDVTRTPMLDEGRLTPYDQSDATRYTAQEYINGVDQMVRIYDATNGDNDSHTNPGSLFLFEDQNDQNNPPKIILRVKYQKHRLSTQESDQVTKYHTLMMLDESNAPCKIHRNHEYQLSIYGIPWEGLGYLTFADAVNSTTYANNQTVTISAQVPEVNNGRYRMSIVGDTYLIFQDSSDEGSTHSVEFTYEAVGPGENTTGIDNTNFTAEWDGEIYDSFASQTVTVTDVSNVNNVYRGRVNFTLGRINNALQGGSILLRDKKTGLTRFINVYTITKFNWLPQGVSGLVLERDGTNTRNVNGVACDTYKMSIRIPGNYPSGLYPIKIRMASTTLNPYKVICDGVENSDVQVVKEGTENRTILDGEELAGMSFVQTNNWNYRKSGEPWDFWYTYTIVSKPTIEDGGATVEDTNPKTYTIYFDDIRPLRDAGNRAANIGLFLKIKYFGDAVAVTP